MIEKYIIAICTLGANPRLENCINNLLAIRDLSFQEMEILVVFNCENPTMTLDDRIIIAIEPSRGYSNVRNLALKKVPMDTNLIFIDDDEVPTLSWFNALIAMHEKFPNDLVAGPVLPFESGSGDSFRNIRARLTLAIKNESVIKQAGSGNLLIPRSALDMNLIWFDPHFNASGSEDTDLCFRLSKNGIRVRFAADAVIYEHEETERFSISYIEGRTLKDAVNYNVVVRRNNGVFSIFSRLLKLTIRLFLFSCLSLISKRYSFQRRVHRLSIKALCTGSVLI